MEFKVDLSNPEEVAAKMPQLLALYEEKLREQKTLNEQVELLRRLVGHASGVSRGRVQTSEQSHDRPSEQPRRRRAAPAQDRAVQALEQAANALGGTAVGPTSLYKFMVERGMEAPGDAGVLGTNLWDAWKAGRIMRAPNGVYTPLDGSGKTEWDRPLTDYYYAAEQGFPIPGSWPPTGGQEYEIKCSTNDEPELQQRLRNVLGQDCPLTPDGRWSPESADRYQCRIMSDLSQWEMEQRLRKGGLGDCSIRRLS